ncbi:hypothetical protein C8Q74DRAFT_1014342 [Fomes fomentarius]|nr:hypothetical protein C8Q74DRAFT_1014342 [Fomes fomentarius]
MRTRRARYETRSTLLSHQDFGKFSRRQARSPKKYEVPLSGAQLLGIEPSSRTASPPEVRNYRRMRACYLALRSEARHHAEVALRPGSGCVCSPGLTHASLSAFHSIAHARSIPHNSENGHSNRGTKSTLRHIWYLSMLLDGQKITLESRYHVYSRGRATQRIRICIVRSHSMQNTLDMSMLVRTWAQGTISERDMPRCDA